MKCVETEEQNQSCVQTGGHVSSVEPATSDL